MSKICAFALTCLLGFTVFIGSATLPAKATEDYWVTKAAIPVPMDIGGVAAVNGKIYAFGYHDDSALTYVYDPATDSWEAKTPMPLTDTETSQRIRYAVAACQDKIYVIGGTVHQYHPDTTYSIGISATNQMYDPSTDTWTTKASLHTARTSVTANVVGDKIYVISGLVDNSPPAPKFTDTTEVYNPQTDTWSTAASIPTIVHGYSSAVLGTKIYVTGGSIAANQIFDAQTNKWSTGAGLPVINSNAPAVATKGAYAEPRIYVIGGRTANYITNATQIYNPATDQWSFGAPFPTTHDWITEYLEATVLNDTIYVFGGLAHSNEGFFEITAQYVPADYAGPTPTPPVPELPVWACLLVLTASGLCFAVIYRKKKERIEG
jgi:N-acetylneuraminic acid mutarotase